MRDECQLASPGQGGNSAGLQALVRTREIVARQTTLITRLVDDLLDIARINRGSIVLQTEEVRLAEIVARAQEMVQPLLDQRHHTLTLELPPEPVLLVGDRARLIQV